MEGPAGASRSNVNIEGERLKAMISYIVSQKREIRAAARKEISSLFQDLISLSLSPSFLFPFPPANEQSGTHSQKVTIPLSFSLSPFSSALGASLLSLRATVVDAATAFSRARVFSCRSRLSKPTISSVCVLGFPCPL